VCQIQFLANNPLHKTFINAGIEAGYPYNEDLNGATQEGFGPAQQTIWNGKRESTGQSFIKPVLE
jgi:choline dehydrogenase